MQNALSPGRRIQAILVALLAVFAITATAAQIGPTDAYAKPKKCTNTPYGTKPDGWESVHKFPKSTVREWCNNGTWCRSVARSDGRYGTDCRRNDGSRTTTCYPGSSDGSEGGPSCNL